MKLNLIIASILLILISAGCSKKAENLSGFGNVDTSFSPDNGNDEGGNNICEGDSCNDNSDDNGSGDNGSGDNGSGDNGSGDNGSGDNGSGDNGSGDNGSGDNGSGDNGSGDNGSGDNGSGDNGSGDNGSGDNGSGDNNSGDGNDNGNGSGDDGAGDDNGSDDNDDQNDSGDETPAVELLINGSFEEGHGLEAGKKDLYVNLPGWTADLTISDAPFEIMIEDEETEIRPTHGHAKLQLDGKNRKGFEDNDAAIYQMVNTEAGKTYKLTLDFHSKNANKNGSSDIEVYWNGDLIDTIQDGSQEWKTFEYELEGIDGQSRLEFRASQDHDTTGGFLDNISLKEMN